MSKIQLCPYTFKKGKNKGKECMNKSLDIYCKKHDKYNKLPDYPEDIYSSSSISSIRYLESLMDLLTIQDDIEQDDIEQDDIEQDDIDILGIRIEYQIDINILKCNPNLYYYRRYDEKLDEGDWSLSQKYWDLIDEKYILKHNLINEIRN